MLQAYDLCLPATPSLLETGHQSVSLQLSHGEIYRIYGPSGSGKTALLQTLALNRPLTNGALTLFGHAITPKLKLSTKQSIRRRIGVLSERPSLCDRLTIFENIALPLDISKVTRRSIIHETSAILKWLHIDHIANLFPESLSSSELLRTACARALVTCPSLLLLEGDTLSYDADLFSLIMSSLGNFIQSGSSIIITTRHDHTMNGLLPKPNLRLPCQSTAPAYNKQNHPSLAAQQSYYKTGQESFLP